MPHWVDISGAQLDKFYLDMISNSRVNRLGRKDDSKNFRFGASEVLDCRSL